MEHLFLQVTSERNASYSIVDIFLVTHPALSVPNGFAY
jgi:hypothetical protein